MEMNRFIFVVKKIKYVDLYIWDLLLDVMKNIKLDETSFAKFTVFEVYKFNCNIKVIIKYHLSYRLPSKQ